MAPSSDARAMDPHGRIPRYDPYGPPYPIDTGARDTAAWVAHPVSDGSMDGSSATHSPTFVESPTLTASDIAYSSSRYGPGPVVEDQKVPLAPLATPPYMFAPSRSLSPAASTPSSSTTSLAPNSYAFTFPEGTNLADRPEFYRRPPQGAPPELTLHGGTADVTAILRMSGRANPGGGGGGGGGGGQGGGGGGQDRSGAVQAPSPYARGDNGSHERESDTESAYTYGSSSSRARTRTGASATSCNGGGGSIGGGGGGSSSASASGAPSRASRSPSPGPPPICGTLAVIKAQAFGALRRTRGRSKKTSEGAAKAAVEALAARGIGVSSSAAAATSVVIGVGVGVNPPAKRPRLHDGDGDLRI